MIYYWFYAYFLHLVKYILLIRRPVAPKVHSWLLPMWGGPHTPFQGSPGGEGAPREVRDPGRGPPGTAGRKSRKIAQKGENPQKRAKMPIFGVLPGITRKSHFLVIFRDFPGFPGFRSPRYRGDRGPGPGSPGSPRGRPFCWPADQLALV